MPHTPFTTRPVILGRRAVVTSGHYLATVVGFRILEQGGNAIDAAAAMCFCLNLLEPQSCGLGGEVPALIYSAKERTVYAVSGMGWSPRALTVEWCRAHSIDLIPGDGYLPACVPAVVDTWALAVARFGKLSFTQILQPAIELAENGFPVYPGLRDTLHANATKFTELYPTTGAVYLPGGRAPEVGDILRNPDWAGVLKQMCEAERAAQAKGRIAGIEAARDVFYRGEIAQRVVSFMRDHPVLDATGTAHTGLLEYADFADWHATLEKPVHYRYHGLDVFKCPAWTQGPVFLQQLALLQGFDLPAMGHNSVDYLHTLIECAKLAFADREAYYGDPDFEDVPYDVLLSDEYAARRRALIGREASREMRPGDVGRGMPTYAATFDVAADNRRALQLLGEAAARPYRIRHTHLGDTTHLDAVDEEGNMVAATPSGGWIGSSPVVQGLGFPMGTRGQMFYLNPHRPNALQPRKRPRATLTPSLVLRNGAPWMVFGTPGGDSQDQWTLQFFLNVVDFGMNIQAALDAPTVHSTHFPSSFYPRDAYPARLEAEDRIDSAVLRGLEARGHEVVVNNGWSHGKCMGICRDSQSGVLAGGVSPRGHIGYALGW
ncbi:MAG: gamma-glutamyltransferase family protein [Anaerolineae bacterium]|nr:gamma-glutamyltransferase family protein [Thermoflexales bacterium]MDW8407972.1 gamma-glutamyltransferase family protein [Anaerolineae bacterium]